MEASAFRFLLAFLFGLFLGCSERGISDRIAARAIFLPDEVRQQVGDIASSVIGVTTEIDYEISTDDGAGGFSVTADHQTISGAGLILYADRLKSRYVILTSKHLTMPEDTTKVFYLDEHGAPSEALFARYVVRRSTVFIHGIEGRRFQSRVVAYDDRADLALLGVETSESLGYEFANGVGYGENLGWGDWVFLFGFPKGIKQVTGGLISPSPYPKTLAVAAGVRIGYSGGPVLFVSRNDGNLVLVGLIESVPVTAIEYVTAGRPLPKGYRLSRGDLDSLIVDQKMLVDYGTAYFLTSRALMDFFHSKRTFLEAAGIYLHERYYGG